MLRRLLPLLAPGGWLLLEEPDDSKLSDRGSPIPTAVDRFMKTWHGIMKSRGAEPYIGARLRGILKESGVFVEVNEKFVEVPMSKRTNGGCL